MAKLAFQQTNLHVILGRGEKLAALHGDMVVPLKNIIGAEALDNKWWTKLGLRVPGTAIPGVIAAGTYIWGKDRAFVCWHRGQQLVQINLTGHNYTRLVIGVDDAQEWVDTVTMYITSC